MCWGFLPGSDLSPVPSRYQEAGGAEGPLESGQHGHERSGAISTQQSSSYKLKFRLPHLLLVGSWSCRFFALHSSEYVLGGDRVGTQEVDIVKHLEQTLVCGQNSIYV